MSGDRYTTNRQQPQLTEDYYSWQGCLAQACHVCLVYLFANLKQGECFSLNVSLPNSINNTGAFFPLVLQETDNFEQSL